MAKMTKEQAKLAVQKAIEPTPSAEPNPATPSTQTKPKVPTIEELHADYESAFKNDQLNHLLNQNPPKSWIKTHPMLTYEVTDEVGNKSRKPVRYLPIDKIEYLLMRIFQQYKIEIIKTGVIFNALEVTVRVHYKNPITGEWMFHDGTGAVDVQTEAGQSAADLKNIKHGAIMKGLPAAKSYAIKDACEHFGRLFGKDLNRESSLEFVPKFTKDNAEAKKSVWDLPEDK